MAPINQVCCMITCVSQITEIFFVLKQMVSFRRKKKERAKLTLNLLSLSVIDVNLHPLHLYGYTRRLSHTIYLVTKRLMTVGTREA